MGERLCKEDKTVSVPGEAENVKCYSVKHGMLFVSVFFCIFIPLQERLAVEYWA